MYQLLLKTFTDFSNDRCPQIAASLSYYTIFALAPLLVIGMMLTSLVFDPEDVRGHVKQELQSLVGEDGATQITTMIQSAEVAPDGSAATVIGIGLLLFGSTVLVNELQSALNQVWGVAPDPEANGITQFLLKRVLSFGMVMGTAFLMLVSLLLSTVVTAFGSWIQQLLPGDVSIALLQAINNLITLLLATLLFAGMFKFMPDAKIAWRDVIVGAILTGSLFVIGKYAMGAYLGSRNMESSYGAAGSLALVLTWVYYSSMIFLYGAEFTQVWARERGVGIRPEAGAVVVDS